jgi:hypothetical protein
VDRERGEIVGESRTTVALFVAAGGWALALGGRGHFDVTHDFFDGAEVSFDAGSPRRADSIGATKKAAFTLGKCGCSKHLQIVAALVPVS